MKKYFSYSLSVFIIITSNKMKIQSECSGNLKHWDKLIHCGAYSDKVTPCETLTVTYGGEQTPQLKKKTIIGAYKYAGISRLDEGGNHHLVYIMFANQGKSKLVSILHQYSEHGWIGSQVHLPLESIDSWDSIKETNKWLMNCMSDDIENCNGKWKLQTEKGRFEHTAIEIHCDSYVNAGVITGIVLFSVALVILIAMAMLFKRKRDYRNAIKRMIKLNEEMKENEDGEIRGISIIGSSAKT